MTPREEGFLLLSSSLGNPHRKFLTPSQLRTLAMRVAASERNAQMRDLTATDLTVLGYGGEMASRILSLLDDTALLQHYLQIARRNGCTPITRVSSGYPTQLRQRLGLESPGVLWAKGDLSLLSKPAVALVGSRDIAPENQAFAAKVGTEAARQGWVLISGNARGADRTAQRACLDAGGQVISVVADELEKQQPGSRILYLSEAGFDTPFSSVRALSRNRIIHTLPDKTMVAQCALAAGGTWSGTVRNLRERWTPVFCFRDGSQASLQLEQLGATLIDHSATEDLNSLKDTTFRLF